MATIKPTEEGTGRPRIAWLVLGTLGVLVAVVVAVSAFTSVTAAGPETNDHDRVGMTPAGRPSSETVPLRLTSTDPPLRKADLSTPALTAGAVFVAPPLELVLRTRAIQSCVVVSGGAPKLTVPPPLTVGPFTSAAPVRGLNHFTV